MCATLPVAVLRPLRLRRALIAAALVVALAAALALLGDGLDGQATARSTTAATPRAATDATGCAYRSRTTQVRHGPASGGKRVALTFDDGPAPLTPAFLDVLEREHVPATFFIVGRNVAGREALLRRALADGFMLGNHSFTHVSLKAGDDAARAELEHTQDAIRTATGFTPCLFRPPYGLSSHRLVDLAGAAGLTSIVWSVNPQDFLRPGTAKIRRRVLDGVRPGSIVLSHDGGGDRHQTLAALPGIIQTLKHRGYRFVTVTDLLGLSVMGR